MENWTRRAIELVTGIALTNKKYPSPIPYYPQKTAINASEERIYERTSPDKVGIRASAIANMLARLESEPTANIHSLVIVKDGKIISETSAPGYSQNIWHLSHSMSKSVIGMAIGLLVDEGKLEVSQKVADFFPELDAREKRFSGVTVEHLLTMTSGVKFSEVGTVSDERWTEAFFHSPMAFAPGEKFHYNSMNSYMLARIATFVSGESLTDYLRPRLFEPLGIKNFFWEKSAEGIEKGGFGLYMSAESWARLGELYLGGGVFGGKRIISESWVKASTSRQIETSDEKGDFDYGYQIWVSRDGKDFLFNGMLGQNVWVIPEENMVISLNSGNNELFQKGALLDIIKSSLQNCRGTEPRAERQRLRKIEASFFESRRAVQPLESKRTLMTILRLRPREPFPKELEPLLGNYVFASNNHGILPLFVRLMQCNYSGGIEGVSFVREGHRLFFISHEGAGDVRIEVGIYGYKDTVIELGGEKYIVRALIESSRDDVCAGYSLELIFPELPNKRTVAITVEADGRLLFNMSETPNHKIAERFFERLPETNPKISFILDLFEKKLGQGFAFGKVRDAFSPSLIGARDVCDARDEIIAEEEERIQTEINKTNLIVSLVERFIFLDDDKETDTDEKPAEKKKGFFSRLFSKK